MGGAGGKHRVTVDDRVWRKIRKRIPGIARAKVKVGVVGSDATSSHGQLSNAELAAIHEFGAPAAGIPARSFLRATFEQQADEYRAILARLAEALLKDTITLDRALDLLGTWGAGAVKATITQGRVVPRLQDSAAGRRTIARKGSSQTLVDTGQLVNSITWARFSDSASNGGDESSP